MAEASTPTKYLNLDSVFNSPSISLISPSHLSNTSVEGVDTAGLLTPTKGTISNIAPKETLAVTPTKLLITKNQSIGRPRIAQVIKAPASSVYHSSAAGIVQSTAAGITQSSAGGRVQYVRLVATQNNNHVDGRIVNVQSGQISARQFVNSVPATSQSCTVQTNYSNQPTALKRVILPAATYDTKLTEPQALHLSNTSSLEHIPAGATILTSDISDADTNNGPMYALLTSNVVQKVQANPMVQSILNDNTTVKAVNIPSSIPAQSTVLKPITSNQDSKLKKPCNCTKSQCLKLYCDCFANGEFCANCNCQNCLNNLQHEEERQKAVKQCLERNPQAFHPKIGKGNKTDSRRHQKGCNCKRSGCLKNYCECYEAKIPCGTMCKCVGCKNYEETNNRKTLMSLANAADTRKAQQLAVSQKLPTHNVGTSALSENTSAHLYLRNSVIQAVMDCLIAQCREAEMARCKDSTTEKVIMEEFGRCLNELINTANRLC